MVIPIKKLMLVTSICHNTKHGGTYLPPSSGCWVLLITLYHLLKDMNEDIYEYPNVFAESYELARVRVNDPSFITAKLETSSWNVTIFEQVYLRVRFYFLVKLVQSIKKLKTHQHTIVCSAVDSPPLSLFPLLPPPPIFFWTWSNEL